MWLRMLPLRIIYLQDGHTWFCLQIEAHDDDVNAVCFADSSSQILYSGSDDGLCKVRKLLLVLSALWITVSHTP